MAVNQITFSDVALQLRDKEFILPGKWPLHLATFKPPFVVRGLFVVA